MLYSQISVSLRRTNAKTPNWTMFREWEIFEHPVLNKISLSNPSPPSSGTLWERRKNSCQSQQGWNTPKKQGLLNRAGLTDIWTHGEYGSISRDHIGLNWRGPSAEGRNGNKTPSLNQKLFPIDNCLQRKKLVFFNRFSLGIHDTLKDRTHDQQ